MINVLVSRQDLARLRPKIMIKLRLRSQCIATSRPAHVD